MNCLDVVDNGINVNGHLLTFPLSYDEIRAVLGEASSSEAGSIRNQILIEV